MEAYLYQCEGEIMISSAFTRSDSEKDYQGRSLRIRHYFFAFLFAVLIAGGLGLSLGIPKSYDYAIASKYQGHFLAFLLYLLKSSILRPAEFSLQCEFTALFMLVLILYVFRHRYHLREILWILLFSTAFAVCVFFGQIFIKGPYWDDCFAGIHQIIKDIWFLAAYGGACFFAMLGLRAWLLTRPVSVPKAHRLFGKKRILVYFLIILACWIPVFLIAWPGNLKGDTVVQILQYFHFPTRFQGQWITDGKDVIFSNDHPFIQTVILGFFMDIGHALGWNELGVSLYTFLQIAGYGAVISAFLVSLEHFRTPSWLTRTALAVFCLAPPYVVHVVLISGDSFSTLFFMMFMLEVFWIYKTGGEVLHHKDCLAAALITIFLFCASKNQCVYIVVLTGLLMLIVLRKEWKRILLAVFLPVLIFETLYMGLFFRLMHISKVGSQEAFSIIFQQTARTVTYHDKELTEDQKEAIAAVLMYEKIAVKYDPDLADPIKKRFNREASSEDVKRFFRVWVELGLTYPGEYVQSFLDSTWGYYYPIKPDQIAELYWDNYNWEEDTKESKWIPTTIPDSFYHERWFHQLSVTENLRSNYRKLMVLVNELPLLSWLAYPGTVMWLVLSLLLLILLEKDRLSLAIFFPTLLVFAICLLSPKNSNFRYMLPNSFLLPLMAAWAAGVYYTRSSSGGADSAASNSGKLEENDKEVLVDSELNE